MSSPRLPPSPQALPAAEFVQLSSPILDVRCPSEFAQGHLPGAVSLPLFTDAERAEVGTAYTHTGSTRAVLLGLERVGPRLSALAATALELSAASPHQPLRIHCWRGGLRSASVAWLLSSLLAVPCVSLAGGYKAFRGWASDVFASPPPLAVVGGRTGSGKTRVLHALRDGGARVVDLEALANHSGSAFGTLSRAHRVNGAGGDAAVDALLAGAQPTQEQFENELAVQLAAHARALSATAGGGDPGGRVWVEDESRPIGRCHIPLPLFAAMTAAPLYLMAPPTAHRVRTAVADYGDAPADALAAAARKLERKLGLERAGAVVAAIRGGDTAAATRLLLGYYDATYGFALARKQKPYVAVAADWDEPAAWAAALTAAHAARGDAGGDSSAAVRAALQALVPHVLPRPPAAVDFVLPAPPHAGRPRAVEGQPAAAEAHLQ
jgi:tRNA 2-selenouridine synthase